MILKEIFLKQSESAEYDKPPVKLSTDVNSRYDFAYPLAHVLGLDCEKIVYKMNEFGIEVNDCKKLMVTFVNEPSIETAELNERNFYGMKYMKYVNVHMDSEDFNKSDDVHKRELILKGVFNALTVLVDEKDVKKVEEICNEIYVKADDTECLFRKKSNKKYSIEIRFKSSLDGYTAILYATNLINKKEVKKTLFERGSFADLLYGIYKISIKRDTCVIESKYFGDNYRNDTIVCNLNE